MVAHDRARALRSRRRLRARTRTAVRGTPRADRPAGRRRDVADDPDRERGGRPPRRTDREFPEGEWKMNRRAREVLTSIAAAGIGGAIGTLVGRSHTTRSRARRRRELEAAPDAELDAMDTTPTYDEI